MTGVEFLPHNFANRYCRPLMNQISNYVNSNRLSLKYQKVYTIWLQT